MTRAHVQFVRKISQQPITALDFGSDRVLALTAERSADGLRLLGGGEAAPLGVKLGRVEHVGDAVEAVHEALKNAERSSGVRSGTVYFNLDDPGIEGTHPTGSKTLKGEGEITAEDVSDAAETAERKISHFDRRILYAREIGFVIDDKDTVPNPLGVFGRKLEVTTHVLSVPPESWDAWQKVFDRARVSRAVPVLSAWSAAYGALSPAERLPEKLVLDLGRDVLNIFLFGNNMVTEHRTLPAPEAGPAVAAAALPVAQALLKSARSSALEAVATGEWAADEAVVLALAGELRVPLRAAVPSGYPKLDHPRFASAAGLLSVAKELEGRAPLLHREKGLFAEIKEKAVSLLNEYF